MRNGDHLYFNLPGGLDDLLNLQASKRENPFYIEKPIRQIFLYEIALPAGWEPVLLPASSRTELPAGAGWVEISVSVKDGHIRILQQAQLNSSIIPSNEYDKLLDLNDLLTAPAAQAILLRKL